MKEIIPVKYKVQYIISVENEHRYETCYLKRLILELLIKREISIDRKLGLYKLTPHHTPVSHKTPLIAI